MKNFDHNSGAYVEIGTARIYYEITGHKNGPVLLVLHGAFGNCGLIRNRLVIQMNPLKIFFVPCLL